MCYDANLMFYMMLMKNSFGGVYSKTFVNIKQN